MKLLKHVERYVQVFVQYQSREWQGALIRCLHRFDNVIDSGWDVTKSEETQSSSTCTSHQFYCIMFTISCSESLLRLLGVAHLHSRSSVKAVASDSSSATSPSLSVLTVKKTPPDSLLVREVVVQAWENAIAIKCHRGFWLYYHNGSKRIRVKSTVIRKHVGRALKCDRKDWCWSTLYLLILYKLSVLEVPTCTTSIQTRNKNIPCFFESAISIVQSMDVCPFFFGALVL